MEQKRERLNLCERVGMCHTAEGGAFPELFSDVRSLTFRNFTIVSPLEWCLLQVHHSLTQG